MQLKERHHFEHLSRKIIGIAIEVHRALGPGFLEKIYEEALKVAFSRNNLDFEFQKEIEVEYLGVIVGTHRLDLIVEDKVIVDNKAKSEVAAIDKQQLLTYLRLNDVRLGLILNFNVPKLVDGVCRVVNQLEE